MNCDSIVGRFDLKDGWGQNTLFARNLVTSGKFFLPMESALCATAELFLLRRPTATAKSAESEQTSSTTSSVSCCNQRSL